MSYLIALTVNLAGMFAIYSLMAFALVRLSWHRRGVIAVVLTIIAAGEFWIVPTLLVRYSIGAAHASHSFWFCNWLVLGFSIIVFCQATRWIPRQLEDSARLDGCGWFGIYWHIILPLVRRELWLIGFLILTGTSILLVPPLTEFDGGLVTRWLVWLLPVWDDASGVIRSVALMMAVSLATTLPLIVVFFFAKSPSQDTTDAGGTGSVPSTS